MSFSVFIVLSLGVNLILAILLRTWLPSWHECNVFQKSRKFLLSENISLQLSPLFSLSLKYFLDFGVSHFYLSSIYLIYHVPVYLYTYVHMYVCIICHLSIIYQSIFYHISVWCVCMSLSMFWSRIGLCHSSYYSLDTDLSLNLELDWWPQNPRESPAPSISMVLKLQA